MKDKIETREERDKDRKLVEDTKAVICFDLQNVITCPRANISNFFYKRTLNVYNLTAHCAISKKKTTYSAVWPESVTGRGGNEIASALVAILDSVVQENPGLQSMILWSDSCVAQNRNSLVTLALKKFMEVHPCIKQIEQNFCTPGHSAIQEVDNIHSHIEKILKISEIFSPVSLMRVLKKVRPQNSVVLQLIKEKFNDYGNANISLKYTQVPFTKVKYLSLENGKPLHVEFKLSFADKGTVVSIRGVESRDSAQKRTRLSDSTCLPIVKPLRKTPQISDEKNKDFVSMLKYMLAQDKEYFEVSCKLPKNKKK